MGETRKCKIRITKEIIGLLPQYQPKRGKIYLAEYIEASCKKSPPICVVNMLGKRIVVRKDEFELVGSNNG